MVRRVSALSQVLKETQATTPTTPTVQPEETTRKEPQNDMTIPQSGITALPHSDNTAKRRSRKTDERDKITYYLDPGQFDKLEEMRTAYKKATGKRLNEQDFMRMIVDRLELSMLIQS